MDMFEELEQLEHTKEYAAVSYAFDVANKIGQILDAKGWTQSQLAKELKVSRQYVSQVLHGNQNMTAKKVAEICFVLGVDPRNLFQERLHGAGVDFGIQLKPTHVVAGTPNFLEEPYPVGQASNSQSCPE